MTYDSEIDTKSFLIMKSLSALLNQGVDNESSIFYAKFFLKYCCL